MTITEPTTAEAIQVGRTMSGVDLSEPISDDLAEELRISLRTYGVLFFHGQDAMQPSDQMRFAEVFGEPYPVPEEMAFLPEEPGVMVLDQRFPIEQAGWHHDGTYDPDPPLCTTLYAASVPPVGGDTVWSSGFAAYDALSDRMKTMLEGLRCVHDVTNASEQYLKILDPEAHPDRMSYAAVHPVVIEDPITGRRSLFVNQRYSTRILDMPVPESRALLDFLFQHIQDPSFHVRLTWEKGTLAIWDNIYTQHSPTGGYSKPHRVMHRVTVRAGEPPYVDPAAA